MSIDVALTHRTNYRYERPITLHPQVVRLRPAPHTRTPILSYALHIGPDEHFINWQQDPFANWQARLVFPETVTEFSVEVDLIARMVAINPFDFFLEEAASEVPFTYAKELKADLAPYLVPAPADPVLRDFVASAPQPKGMTTNDFMVALNQFVEGEVGYIVRMEPGVQTPAETIVKAKGSCRDSGWLLVQMLRQHGFAARFVSGYLIQLAPDQKAVDGPSGPEADFTDLHAWAEVYLPGAGWVGLDPTSGLFAGEGHIPLAATPAPQSAAPISGSHEPAEVEFGFEMKVERVRETPRVTAPIPDTAWSDVMAAGRAVDARLTAGDVRLTVGGEPTFISAYDRDAEEWTVGAVGPTKRGFADKLIRRLRDRFAPGGMLHYGQGKWYPGEQLPRWAFALYWRTDGVPFWRDQALIAPEGAAEATPEDAERFMGGLCEALGVEAGFAAPAFEDPAEFLLREQNLAPNVDPVNNRLEEPEERERLARVFDRGLGVPAAWVLPLQLAQAKASGARRFRWMSERWRTRRGRLFLIPGDSPAGFRLPLKALAWLPEAFQPQIYQRDPFAVPRPLPRFQSTGAQMGPAGLPRLSPGVGGGAGNLAEDWFDETLDWSPALWDQPDLPGADAAIGAYFLGPAPAVRTALTVEARAGRLTVFLPPTGSADEYADLVAAVEETAAATGLPVHVEGYTPPPDPRLNVIKVTPDPGVIEINIHPAASWEEQVAITEALYEEARQCHLDTASFMVDGRPTGSGGGNHIVLGAAEPGDSPFLRRPDLLGSIIRFWQRHPSLSYLFSGMFIGPTSQAPRIDEARHEALYEMEIALSQLPGPAQAVPPWLTDRLFRHLLTDVTGNTHRAEICIDKLYSPDGPAGRLGLVEFRGFEMPPHPRMALAQGLLLRALVAWFWEAPYRGKMIRWGTTLHDRFMLPHFVWTDFQEVLAEASEALGLRLDPEWFRAQYEFRFPLAGSVEVAGVGIELRSAIEPWHVLGEEGTVGGTARYVDSSLERLQVRVTGELGDRYALAVNGIEVPLSEAGAGTGTGGGGIAGIRFRAWQPPSALHPTIPPHGPLVFDLVDRHAGRSVGGCTYHVSHPGGRSHETRPVNALEAEGRRLARFFAGGQTPGPMVPRRVPRDPEYPHTLDLRRVP